MGHRNIDFVLYEFSRSSKIYCPVSVMNNWTLCPKNFPFSHSTCVLLFSLTQSLFVSPIWEYHCLRIVLNTFNAESNCSNALGKSSLRTLRLLITKTWSWPDLEWATSNSYGYILPSTICAVILLIHETGYLGCLLQSVTTIWLGYFVRKTPNNKLLTKRVLRRVWENPIILKRW